VNGATTSLATAIPANQPQSAPSAVKVLYFARIAEMVGHRSESLPLTAAPISGTDFLALLQERYPQLAPAARLKLAVNQTHAKASVMIHDGDEVAVFEPVTGG
jgi:molybdopterin synthase sulfur carrier subunit